MQQQSRNGHNHDPQVTRTNTPPSPQAARPGSPALAAGASLRFGVRLGSYSLLIAPQTFSEVLVRPVIAPLPHTPRWFLGLVNQRSTLVPVFDIHQVLHTKEAQSDQHTVLVLDQGNDAVGMCIDDIPQAVMLERRVSQTPPLPDPLAAHVVAAYSAGQTVWLDLDHRGLFTTLGAAIAVSSADSYP